MDAEAILRSLTTAGADFIIVGGYAAMLHGSARLTSDIDVLYRRSAENHERLITALAPYKPYLRGAPPGLPFSFDAATLKNGLNFTLVTSLGDVDLLGEIPGGRYEDLLPAALEIEVFGVRCRCLGLRKLIDVKRAAGRPKDLEAVAELEAIAEERSRR